MESRVCNKYSGERRSSFNGVEKKQRRSREEREREKKRGKTTVYVPTR
jgi:hypothetical protein